MNSLHILSGRAGTLIAEFTEQESSQDCGEDRIISSSLFSRAEFISFSRSVYSSVKHSEVGTGVGEGFRLFRNFFKILIKLFDFFILVEGCVVEWAAGWIILEL